jgi:hypothetical protein
MAQHHHQATLQKPHCLLSHTYPYTHTSTSFCTLSSTLTTTPSSTLCTSLIGSHFLSQFRSQCYPRIGNESAWLFSLLRDSTKHKPGNHATAQRFCHGSEIASQGAAIGRKICIPRNCYWLVFYISRNCNGSIRLFTLRRAFWSWILHPMELQLVGIAPQGTTMSWY